MRVTSNRTNGMRNAKAYADKYHEGMQRPRELRLTIYYGPHYTNGVARRVHLEGIGMHDAKGFAQAWINKRFTGKYRRVWIDVHEVDGAALHPLTHWILDNVEVCK